MIEGHPGWAGKVRGLMVNAGNAAQGISGCSKVTTLPLLQDTPDDKVGFALGGSYNSFLVVDREGIVRHRIQNVYLSNDPTALVQAVESIL